MGARSATRNRSASRDGGNRGLALAVCLVLSAVTAAVYAPVLAAEFVTWDDNVYVTENPVVRSGLTPSGVLWAFANFKGGFWQPLTWLSHMLDCTLFGMNPRGHHLTSLLLHITNSCLLFLLLARMTGGLWRSVLVAGLFALHPLHVESVAWIADRKDVLSTFFLMLSLLAYVRYAEESAGSHRSPVPPAAASGRFPIPTSNSYLLFLLFFALGLMSKSMLVTLPFLLLLLDFWPLGRMTAGGADARGAADSRPTGRLPYSHLIVEKWPALALSAVFCVLTYLAEMRVGAVSLTIGFPLGHRLANALVSFATYLGKVVWPVDLAAFYPYPSSFSPPAVLLAGTLLAGGTALAVFWRSRPYLAVGWLWFLGGLLPVIGIIQLGSHAMADRYMYVPLIGLAIMLAWGLHDAASSAGGLRRAEGPRAVSVAVAVAMLAACAAVSARQVGYWKNDETLFTHAVAVTRDNYLMLTNLGHMHASRGDLQTARDCFIASMTAKPNHPEAHYNMALLFDTEHKPREAIDHYKRAIEAKPDYSKAINNLAWMLATAPEPELRDGVEALRLAERAVSLGAPNDPSSLDTLAAACAETGDFARATSTAESAVASAIQAGQTGLANEIRARVDLYRNNQPFHGP
jgi:Tfp pilus assembly protein PilF